MSQTINTKDAASIVWQYWLRTIINNDSITIKDITQIIIDYYNPTQVLQWSRKLKSKDDNYKAFHFSDEDKCVEMVSGRNDYRWISPDIEPVYQGIHCWRVNVNHTKPQSKGGFIVFGVSPPNPDLDDRKGEEDVWGVTCNNYWYPTDHIHDKGTSNCDHLYRKHFEVDILLDLQQQTLKIGIVGESGDEHQYEFKGIGKTNKFGAWLPHFMLYSFGDFYTGMCSDECQLRIAEISPDFYGECISNIFQE